MICFHLIKLWIIPLPKINSPTVREEKYLNVLKECTQELFIETGELLEEFLWDEEKYNKEHVLEELADVMVYCIHMADALDVDLEEIINNKMDKNEKKYPVEKAKGNSKKYTEL